MESTLRLTVLKLFAAVVLWNAVGTFCFGDVETPVDSFVGLVCANDVSNDSLPPTGFKPSPFDPCNCLRYGTNPTGRSFQKTEIEVVSVNMGADHAHASSDSSLFADGDSLCFTDARRHLIFCCLRN